MNRRALLLAALASPLVAAAPPTATRTRWIVSTSEAFDALCFLGPLSGKPFYARYYEAELAAFSLPADGRAALDSLQAEADAANQLLGPDLCTLCSGAPVRTLAELTRAIVAAETAILPPYKASAYWDEENWTGFLARRERLLIVLRALQAAGFPALRERFMGEKAKARVAALSARLAGVDVIAEQERLLGHALEPSIEIVLMWFSKPHGIRIQGQRFLSHLDYPDELSIRIAGHEILHPPFDMDGPEARAALAVLGQDALMTRIVAEHDPAFGYNSLEGLLNEDTVQALDQIIAERLGVATPPAVRWAQSDDGMHVLAAGLYGLLKAGGYDRTGGNIAAWMLDAARTGKLAPARLHPAAAAVLNRPTDTLWPLKPRA